MNIIIYYEYNCLIYIYTTVLLLIIQVFMPYFDTILKLISKFIHNLL